MVYYLLGKVYKKLGQEHLALMNLSRATDMDPRGAYTQIKESLDPVRESGSANRTGQSEGGGSVSPGQSTPVRGSSGSQAVGGHIEGHNSSTSSTPGLAHSRHLHSPGMTESQTLKSYTHSCWFIVLSVCEKIRVFSFNFDANQQVQSRET